MNMVRLGVWLSCLVVGCTAEPEPSLAPLSSTSIIDINSASSVLEGFWFTGPNWEYRDALLLGGGGHAVFETEARYPELHVEVASHRGRLAIGYLGQDIRTGYDPNEEADPAEDWTQTRLGYVVEFTETTCRLLRATEGGTIELASSSVIADRIQQSEPWSLRIRGEYLPGQMLERIQVDINGMTLFDGLVPEPLEQGRAWIQVDGEVALRLADIRLSGAAPMARELGGRTIRGIVAAAVSPADRQRVWLASGYASVGVLRSDNGGDTYHPVYNGLHFLSVAPDPENADGVLVGDKVGQIHRSRNGGLSWQVVRRVATVADKDRSVGVFGIVHDRSAPDRVVAASATGLVLESLNRGGSWSSQPGPIGATSLALSEDGTAYIGTEDGVYRDVGGTFVAVVDGPLNVTSLANVGDTVYAGAADGLFRIDGEVFTPVVGIPGGLIGAITSDEVNGGVVVASAAGVYRVTGNTVDTISDDTRDKVAIAVLGGRYLIASPDPGHYQEYFQAFDPPVSGPSDGATAYVTEAGAWSAVAASEADGGAVATDVTGQFILAAGMCGRGVYASTDGGATFTHQVALETRYVQQLAIARETPSTAFIAASVGVLSTKNSGATWSSVADGAYFTALATDSSGLELWFGTSTVPPAGVDASGGSVTGIGRSDVVIYRSNNGGETHDEVRRFTDVSEVGAGISAIALASPERVLFTITADEESEAVGLWQYENGASQRLQSDTDLTSVAVDSRNPERVAISSGRGVFLSTDGGATVSSVSREWTESVAFTTDGRWIAGGEGIVLLGDEDSSVHITRGLHGRTIEALAYAPSENRIITAISGIGIKAISIDPVD